MNRTLINDRKITLNQFCSQEYCKQGIEVDEIDTMTTPPWVNIFVILFGLFLIIAANNFLNDRQLKQKMLIPPLINVAWLSFGIPLIVIESFKSSLWLLLVILYLMPAYGFTLMLLKTSWSLKSNQSKK